MDCTAAKKSTLILCGDYMEDYEVILPFFFLQAFGIHVDCVSPNKKSGDKCVTVVHDFLGFETYTELPGHFFTLNSDFDKLNPESYDSLFIPGGRFVEPFSVDEKVINIVKRFGESGKIIATSCHSQLLLVAAGLLRGKKCTSFPSLKPTIELSGGIWWQQPGINSLLEVTQSLKDGNIISSLGWPTYGDLLKLLIESIGGQISALRSSTSVLFLCGDFVDDYEINVTFRALQALGCKVDAVSPTKKKGETCVTAIYDDEGGQISSEKRGHNFPITADWDEIHVDDYQCMVTPGGRSSELLLINENAISLVKEFAQKEKILAAIGQGQWLLAAAGILKGKRCASSHTTELVVKVAGGIIAEESESCVIDRNLVTASGWPALPTFVSELSHVLGFSIVF